MYKLGYSEIFSEAWAAIKEELALVAGLTFVVCFGMWVLSHIPYINIVLSGGVWIGYMRCLLQIQKKESMGFSDFFWGFTDLNRLLHIVILNFLQLLGIGLGFLFLIIPGIWFMVAGSFAPSIFATTKQDGIEAIKQSMDLVKGRWFNIAGFMFIQALINIAGALCFGIGMLISIPVSVLALLIALKKLQAMTPVTPVVLTGEPAPTASTSENPTILS